MMTSPGLWDDVLLLLLLLLQLHVFDLLLARLTVVAHRMFCRSLLTMLSTTVSQQLRSLNLAARCQPASTASQHSALLTQPLLRQHSSASYMAGHCRTSHAAHASAAPPLAPSLPLHLTPLPPPALHPPSLWPLCCSGHVGASVDGFGLPSWLLPGGLGGRLLALGAGRLLGLGCAR